MKHHIKTVVSFEVMRQLKKPSFWIALLIVPLLILGITALSAFDSYNTTAAMAKTDLSQTFGITDQTKLTAPILAAKPKDQPFKLTTFANKAAGIEAIKKQKIDVYYFVPADLSKPIELYTPASNGSLITTSLEAPLRSLLGSIATQKIDPTYAAILSGSLSFKSINLDKDGKEVNLLGQAILPFAVLAIFYILISVFGNRLLFAVTEEKENRISEMILTAISARDLIVGKIISMILLGFLQIAVFIIPVVSIIVLNRANPTIAYFLSIIEINPVNIITNLLLLITSYILFASCSCLVGSLVSTAREASQYMAVSVIGMVLPFFFMSSILAPTASLLTYALSFFPLSAPITLMIRSALGTLPLHELLIGLSIIIISAIITLFFAVKSFQKNAINFSPVHFRINLRPKKSWKN